MTLNQSMTQSYLAASVCGQKAGAKLGVSYSAGRSQRRPAMAGDEEAGPLHSAGSRFDPDSGRVCALVTKPVAPGLRELPLVANAVSHGAPGSVMREVMRRQRHSHRTGEVPPCPALGRVTRHYKASPKGCVY